MSVMKRNIATRIYAIMLCIALLLSAVPVSVITAFAATTDMGILSGITAGGVLSDENGDNAVITYSNTSLEWSAAEPSIGRNVDGWWVGMQITAPANLKNADDFNGVTYQRKDGEDWVTKNFWDVKDSKAEDTTHFLTMWGVVNEQYLNDAIMNGKSINYIYRFDWNADGDYEQTATLKIEPEDIILNKDNAQVYPTTDGNGTVYALSDGLMVNNANANYVEVVYNSNVSLKYTLADSSVGRMSDGWWAGMKITAPDNLKTAEDFEKGDTDVAAVTYQRKDGDSWTTNYFWDAQDSDKNVESTERFLTIWGLINEAILDMAKAKTGEKTANYIYRFDWDKDGVYEQIVVLKINPDYITLVDENDVQVYPKLATVESLSGGTVSGSGTGETVVDISDVSLNWSAADISVGRGYDAWWAGAKITAPEGSDSTSLANAQYRNRATSSTSDSGWNEWTVAKSFLEYKDGNYYITVWCSITRELAEKYKAKNMKVQSQYEFDWDGNGIYDQVITISIDPEVTLNRIDRTDFVFEDAATDKEVWVADGSLPNKAESVNAPGEVTYEIDTANTTVADAQVDSDGKVTFGTTGKITVNATIAEDDVYNAKTISYSFNVVKKQPENLTFAIQQPSDVVYGQKENVFENAINVPEDCKVEYSIKSQEKLEDSDSDVAENPVATIDKTTGKITVKRSGKITVVATITADDPKYKDKSAEYELTIKKADQTGFGFTADSPESFVYSTTAYDTVKVEGGQVDGAAIKYEITEGTDVAEVVDTSSIKTLKSGKFTLSVTKAGNDCYKPVTVTREMEVALAEQTTFAFTYPTPNSITYNENGNKYENVAIEGESTGKVTYKVVLGNDVADFENSENPAELTIKKAGTVKVEATKAADDRYAAKTISYEITVEKAEQTFTFTDGTAVVKNYGITKYSNTVISTVDTSKADGVGHGEGAFSYTLEKNNIGATIDALTGEISFSDSTEKVGKVKITVTRETDEKYKACSNEFTVEIKYLDTPNVAYTIDKSANENGWYNSDIKILAPEGYEISYSDSVLETNTWGSFVNYNIEGKTEPIVYLRKVSTDTNKEITAAISVKDINIDKCNPINLNISYDITIWETILEKIFGFKSKTVTVTLTAEESIKNADAANVSGLNFIEYLTDGSDDWTKAVKVNFDGSYSFKIDPQYRNQVKFRVTDKADNTSEIGEDGKIIVVDAIDPVVDFTYDYNDGFNQKVGDIIYAGNDVKFGIELEAANIGLAKNVVVKVNDQGQDVEWSTVGDLNKTSITFSDTGDYIIYFEYEDYLGRTVSKTQEIHIDKEAPTISDFTFNNGAVITAVDNRKYYNENQTVTVTIAEHNFNYSNIDVIVISDNSAVDVDKYKADYKLKANWNDNGDETYTANIPFTNEGNYTLTVSCTDLADNNTTTETVEFSVDKTSPTKPVIKLNKSLLANVLETITFGFFQGEIEVTATSSDDITDIKRIELYYYEADGITLIEKKNLIAENGSVTDIISGNFKGRIKAIAYDLSENVSETQDIILDVNETELKGIVLDNISPDVKIEYTGSLKDKVDVDVNGNKPTRQTKNTADVNTRYIYDGNITATITVDEANFYEEDIDITVYRDGSIVVDSVISEWTEKSAGKFVKTIELSKDGDYQIKLDYQDKSDNKMNYDATGEYAGNTANGTGTYTSNIHTIDTTAPTYSVVYNNNNVIQSIEGRDYFDAARTATITVTDRNFRPNEVDFKVVAKDIADNDVTFNYSKLTAWSDWTTEDNLTWIATVLFGNDANYSVDIAYEDLANNKAADYTADEFIIDTIAPENIQITYSTPIVEKVLETITFGFYQANVEVTVTAEDMTSGVDYFDLTYTRNDGDNKSNKDTYVEEKITATQGIDKKVFTATHTVEADARGTISVRVVDKVTNDSSRDDLTINKGIIADVTAPEWIAPQYEFASGSYRDYNNIYYTQGNVTATFTIKEANFDIADKPVVTVATNGGAAEAQSVEWKQTDNTDNWVGILPLTGNGDYVINVTFQDGSQNTKIDYTQEVHIDDEKSVFDVTYDNNAAANVNNYNADRTATIKVTEHNFKADEVKAYIKVRNITGKDLHTLVDEEYSKTYCDYVADTANWYYLDVNGEKTTDVKMAANADEHYIDIEFRDDAIYTVAIDYTDLAGNKAVTYTDEFVVDKTNATNIKIEYSESLGDRILNTITFGMYKGDVVVTITAEDVTSGVDYFNVSYTRKDDANKSNRDNYTVKNIPADRVGETNVFTATHTVPADSRGTISVEVFDKATNDSLRDDLTINKGIIADVTAPEWIAPQYEFASGSYRDYDGIYYTQSNVTATFTIKEANFDIADKPVVNVATNGGGAEAQSIEWKQTDDTDNWVGILPLTGNGDYKVKVTFADRSTNAMTTYEKEIHIDNEKPVFDVTYDNNAAANVNNYKADRTATIKVTEHNFKAEEVELVVTAKDITGKEIDLSSKDYNGYAKNPANWTKVNDVWTLMVDGTLFNIDGIYSVTLNYEDLAENVADTYSTEFVVDKTKATNIKIEYSESIVDKVLETITFGFYQGDVIVTVTAEDMTSGVDYFEITYTAEDGANNSNKATYKTEELTAIQDETNKNVFTATHTITAQARGTVSVDVTDKATNGSSKADNKILVADTTVPGIVVDYTFVDDQVREYNNIYYTQNETGIKFTITEANFDIAEKPVVTVNGTPETVEWTQTAGTDEWVGNITLTGNGDYKVKVTFADRSTNAMTTYEKEIHIDNEKPVFDVTYDNNAAANVNNYKADRTATIKVTEHNFKAEEVELVVTAKDITGKEIDLSSKAYDTYAKNSANWSNEGDVWTLKVDGTLFNIDGIYSVTLNYEDLAENVADTYSTEFVIDHKAPTDLKITYSTPILERLIGVITFGYYQPSVTVTLTADDITSGVDYFNWSYTKEEGSSNKNADDIARTITSADIVYSNNGKTATATFTIPANARGYISATVTDRAANADSKVDDKHTVVVDEIAPTRTVTFTPERVLDEATLLDVPSFNEGDNVILYYKNSATATFKIDEANFYSEDVVIKVSKNGGTPTVKAPTDWTQNGDVWTGTITLSGDGDYVITMTYTDRSTNEMVAYESQEIRIDATAPVINVAYNPNDATANGKYFNCDREATITVTEHNFRAEDVVATITAKDVTGKTVTITDFDAYLKDRNSWTTVGDVHTAKITFTTDAQYTFKFDSKDIIGNEATQYVAPDFVVDHNKPTNLKITYSTSLVDKVLETITFGFYKADVTVTITADDITSGVDYFEYKYVKQTGTSDVNAASSADWIKLIPEAREYTNDGKTATVSFKLPANARGYITARAFDRATNIDTTSDNKIMNVVDNIKPGITVNYVADDTNTKVQYTDDADVTKNSFAEGTTAYFNGNVTAKITINEANFFEGKVTDSGEIIHNVGILLTKTDDNGVVTKYEYLPNGSVQKYSEATAKDITWTTNGDVHTFDIKYDADSEYVLTIDYTDLSTNDATINGNDGNAGNAGTKTYTSKTVTIDKTAPVVDVKYSNTNIIHTLKERDTEVKRDYYDAVQTATITVTEHNFRADDFAATVTAKDIVGADIDVEDFKATLANDSKWTSNGNVHTITINYSVDANYTFDYEYQDLAQNEAKDYDVDVFTVDKTPTKNLTVTYEDSILDKVLETVTFGFYGGQTKVTITAEDDVSGVYYFVYSYVKSEGVSGVNAELLNDKLEEANGNLTHNGKVTTTFFTIPKEALGNTNQFNGTVKFTAYDRSENSTEKVDTKRIVVDNIKPTATITYNEPVQTANDISYYAGNIDAKIVVNEANFYSEDVIVTVTKDGSNHPVSVKWVDDSVDVHTGTFTLTEDGDYIIDIKYKDRSDNEMAQYTSNRLTLDTKAPTVSVTNIKINSANKDEKYGFTITANDINLDSTTFKPVLTATIRNEDGSYGTKTISLGDMKTVEAGKTYSFTVDNLTEDAYYSLVCTLKDMSGNEYSKIALADGKEYDKVEFSINRNGSTFAVNDATNTLINQYYVYSVNEDVVISEVNVDPIETYVVKLNGEILTEGTDYTTSLSDKAGEWSKRTYVISKELFESEGEYNIVIESTDKTDTTAYSDVKNLNVSFVVDQTAPVLTISGLEEGGRYQVDEQTVTVIPTDDGGRLYSIKVVVYNSDGKPLTNDKGEDISVRFEMSGDELLTYLSEHDGKITFTVPEGLENQVQIICNDCAVNEDGKTNEYNETFMKVTVSQSSWIIFYANKPLFYGSIAGVVLLTAGIIFLIIFLKKRKKDESK